MTEPTITELFSDFHKGLLPRLANLTRAFEEEAQRAIAEPAKHAFWKRLASITQDFRSHLDHIFSTTPPELLERTGVEPSKRKK
jgi:hypothetical protein